MMYLGIDTSNYTTSAALYGQGKVVENRKLPLPVRSGARGLRQSDAVFHHSRGLPQLLCGLLPQQDLGAIGVSASPTTEEGSYMPCFLPGLGQARVLGAALDIPVYEFSHQQGHIAAALYSAGRLDLLEETFLAFHVSGGTTEALIVSPISKSGGGPGIRPAARSLDLKAGQAVDRVGVAMGLPFPCGPHLERLALMWDGRIKVRPSMKGADCSLSGIENQCLDMLKRGRPKEETARYCIESIAAALKAMCSALRSEHGEMPLVFSGGVCGNSIIRQELQGSFNAGFAAPEFSSDNAAGVALLAALAHEQSRQNP